MNSKNIFLDIKSGIVVFLVALPLCLGIALACNVSMFSGIVAGVIGGIIVTIFSGSALSVSGPAAGLTAIILSSVAILGSFEALLAATICAGVLQIIFGLVKLGNIGNYIPSSVIKGMLAGIGIILIIKQLPHLVGYDKDPEGDFFFEQSDGHNSISELFYMLNYITPGAVIVGVVSIALILISDSTFYKKIPVLSFVPGPLLVVAVGILLNIVFSAYPLLIIEKEHLISLPAINNLADLKGALPFPDFNLILTQKFIIVVITLAIVASIESLLSVEAADKLDPLKRNSNSNKELMAQGIGNILCGLAGALPVTAVIVRSSANIQAGATSKLSAIIHAILLAGCVLLIPHILELIPNASLAAILIMTGYKLTKFEIFKEYYKKGIDQFLPLVVTIAVMLITDLLKGVGAGLVLAVIFIIRSNIRTSFDAVNEIIDGKMHYVVKLPQHLTFFNKGYLLAYFDKVVDGSIVIIDGSINKTTDKEIKEVILEFTEKAKINNIKIEFIKYNLNT